MWRNKLTADDFWPADRPQAAVGKPFKVVHLTRDGRPSRAHDATIRFTTTAEALAYIDQYRQQHPTQRFAVNF